MLEQWWNMTSAASRCRFTLFGTLKAIGHDFLNAFQLVDESLLATIKKAGEKLENLRKTNAQK